MANSMTGYGKGEFSENGFTAVVEIKSVNNRYLDVNVNCVRELRLYEKAFVDAVKLQIERGKVDMQITVSRNEAFKEPELQLDLERVEGYLKALRRAGEALELADDLTLNSILKLPDIFKRTQAVADSEGEEFLKEISLEALSKALDNLKIMREAEGRKLAADIRSRLGQFGSYLTALEGESQRLILGYKEKLAGRLRELVGQLEPDSPRILLEAGIMAERMAVDEELVRLRSHVSQFNTMMSLGNPIGRRLDFLVQEMNREVNTIGSKLQDVTITSLVVDMKSELEKIREQIQNLE